MSESEIKKVIDDAYRRAFARFGYRSLELRFGTDHLGDPAIFATAHFEDRGGEGLPAGVQGPLLLEIFDELQAKGESRFPYVHHAYPAPAE